MPTRRPSHPLSVSALLLWGALAAAGAAAQGPSSPAAPAPPSAERMSQQLREAIERANAQRAQPGGRTSAAAKAEPATPSVTLNIGQGGALRVLPTPPTPPASTPPARGVPARTAAQVTDDEVPPQRAAPAPAPRASTAAAADAPRPAPAPARASRPASQDQVQLQFERARAIANGLPIPVHARLPRDGVAPAARQAASAPPPPWSYSGAGGPAAWARLQSEFELCGSGQRQAPIHIEESAALQGPNEVLGFDYRPSTGTVLHDGRTIRVEVQGDNLLQVRGSTWRLAYFDFRHPAEEVVNHSGFAMGVHLVHRNAQGQTAIVAVLLQPGEANPFIDRVWTYIPLDAGDSVRMPADWLDLATLLPQDQRYYQFFGSLTQPPCTEGVLWMVLKQPVTLSPEQLRLFAQMFPANARPVQALNGRIVRDAQ